MTILFTYILIISNFFAGSPPLYREYQILETSKIQIKGTSNIAGFRCNCNMKELNEMYVRYEIGKQVQNKASIQFPISSFNCGAKAINRDFMDLVKAKEYPNLNLKVLEIKPIDDQKARIHLEAGIAGQKNKYSVVVHYERFSDYLQARGKFSLNIEDFGLEQPKKLMGLVVINKEIDILFNLHFRSLY